MAGSDLAFRHAMRLIEVIRNPKDGDLLVQLLDDAPVTVENVTKLLQFARTHLGNTPRIEEVCVEYLRANNAPIPEVKTTGCVLDEFEFSEEAEHMQRVRLEIWAARNNRRYEEALHRYAWEPEFRKVIDAIDGGSHE